MWPKVLLHDVHLTHATTCTIVHDKYILLTMMLDVTCYSHVIFYTSLLFLLMLHITVC